MKLFSFFFILLVASSDCFGKNKMKVFFVFLRLDYNESVFDAFGLENEITDHFRISSSILASQGY